MPQKVTRSRTRMVDIAAHAGVSTATVSRVFNDVGQVSESTRRRVLTAIDVLGYERPSTGNRTDAPSIGIIVPELTNPVFSSFSHAFQAEASQAGAIALIASQTPGSTSEAEYIDALVDHGAAGLVFVSGRHADFRADLSRYEDLHSRRIPFVTINGSRPQVAAPDFSTGDDMGVRAAVRHLKELGHRRIALVGGNSHVVPALRKITAFREAMSREFGENDPVIIETFYTYEAAASATAPLIEAGITAIIAGSDLQALGSIRTIGSLGLSVPADVSVIGYDDSMLMPHLAPPLTTVHQPVESITRAAMQTLLVAMGSTSPQMHADFVYTPALIVRSSTGRARTF